MLPEEFNPSNDLLHGIDWEGLLSISPQDIQRAMVRRLEQEYRFFNEHQDDVDKVAARLGPLADAVRIGCFLGDDYREGAVRLGLSLRLIYWMRAGMVDRWPDHLGPLMHAARELRDKRLLYEVFNQWGYYLYFSQGNGASAAANSALSYLESYGGEDIQLVVRLDQVNFARRTMAGDDLLAQLHELRREAVACGDRYALGRVHYTLGATYLRMGNPNAAFNYAQQALIYFWPLSVYSFSAGAVSFMLGSLQQRGMASFAYRRQLLELMETLTRLSRDPMYEAAFYFQFGVDCYQNQDYDQALESLLDAEEHYHAIGDTNQDARLYHMLGMIETNRGECDLAEHYFDAAEAQYEADGQVLWGYHVRNARAMIPAARGDFAQTVVFLEQLYDDALALPQTLEGRDQLLAVIQQDIANTRAQMESVAH